MPKHTIEACPDDLDLLQQRLDALSDMGARIVTVLWRPRRVSEEDQSAALDASGSFAVIYETSAVLRDRHVLAEETATGTADARPRGEAGAGLAKASQSG